MPQHLPLLWRFRLLWAIKAKGNVQNRLLLRAWAQGEGGNAAYNPLNTTQPWPGATDYNPDGVRNYPSGKAGIAATAETLLNGHYPKIVANFRKGTKSAVQMVNDAADEFDVWGTGAALILRVLDSYQV